MRKAYVKCPECKEESPANKVKFIDIESDFQERDVMTFECPHCKKEVKSWITLKY